MAASGLTFADVRDARPGDLRAAAAAWSELATALTTVEKRVVAEVTGPLHNSGWQGDAANTAFGIVELLDDEAEVAAMQLSNAAAVMRAAADEFEAVHRQLLAAVYAATDVLGLEVDEFGHVYAVPPSAGNDAESAERYQRAQNNADIYDDILRGLIERAGALDDRFATALLAFAPHFTGQQVRTEYNDATEDARRALALLGLSEASIPAHGTDPAAAAAWWAGLTADQRGLLLTAYPDLVGGLDGLPAVDRDRANRLELRDLLGEVDLRTYNNDERDPRYVRILDLNNRLEAAEYAPEAQQLFLLGLDNDGDGRGIVAVGNPDPARHTAVLVPGFGTDLADLGGQIARAGRLRDFSDALTSDMTGDVSVIAWLGYDPPDGADVALGGAAESGAAALDPFVDGLRTAHAGDGHLSLVGHSYGSTVLGEAASHGNGIAADDLITLGSPGMRTDHAADLNVGADHVWAGAAPDDQVANPQVHSKWYSLAGPIGDIVAWAEDKAHGISPHEPDFGANQFVTDTSGHSGYWETDSESLRNQARIVVGQYDRVTLVHGPAS